MDPSKFCSVSSFFSQNELWQRPGLAPRGRTQSSRAVERGRRPVRHVSGDPPYGQRKDAGSDWSRLMGSARKRGPGAPAGDPSHPRPGAAPPCGAHPGGGGAASTHRVRRWAGPLGTRTAAPPRLRGGVSARHTPSGPPPGPRLGAPRRRRRPRLHGEGKRLRGDWAGGGDGGRGPGSELDGARASLSAPHSPQPRSRPGLGCKVRPHWRFRDGRWLAHTERASPGPRGLRPCAPPSARSHARLGR